MKTLKLTEEELGVIKTAVITMRCDFMCKFPVAYNDTKELYLGIEAKLKEAEKTVTL